MIMENEIKKTFKKYGVMSIFYIQRKYRLNQNACEKILKRISSEQNKKIYSGKKLIRIKTTSDNIRYVDFKKIGA